MVYRSGLVANLAVLAAMGAHIWQYPSSEYLVYAVLPLPILLLFFRWARMGPDRALIPAAYKDLRRTDFRFGTFLIRVGLVFSLAVLPVFIEIARGERYLYVSGGLTFVSACLIGFGILIVEADLMRWQKWGSNQ